MDRDPTPGDPEEVRELADDLREFADDVGEALGKIRGLAGERAVLDWAGLSADTFRAEFDGVPGNLSKLEESYALCSQALQSYWPQLQTAQGMADRALDRAISAQADLANAQTALGDATDWVGRAGDEAERLQREGERDNVEPPDEADVRNAARDQQAAQAAAGAAQARVDDAEERLSAARQLAQDAQEMRTEAARQCAQGIDEASDAGIQNRKWWQKAIKWVTDNWDTLVEICKVIVAVLGVVVMIIGGPLAWVVLAAALVVLADTLIKFAQGKAGLLDVAFAALDCIPGMKGVTTLGGLARGLRGGLSAARTGLRGAAGHMRRLAGNARRTISDGAQGAYDRMRDLVRRGDSDPIDMATGHMFLPQSDVLVPGLLPLAFTRHFESGYQAGFWFGPGWASTVDQRIEADDEGLVVVTDDGLLLTYPHPELDGEPLFPDTGPRWSLTRLPGNAGFRLVDPESGLTRHYAPLNGQGYSALVRVTDRNDNALDFEYDENGIPSSIRHSAGQRLLIEVDRTTSKVTALALENGGGPGVDLTVRTFRFDGENLTEVVDTSTRPLRFTYDEQGRITAWTDRNGHRYAYVYDERNRCVAEGGEAGHISLKLEYDGSHPDWPGARVTTVTTSPGVMTRYVINEVSDVIAEIDPLGNVIHTEFDDHHQIIARTDALGGVSRVERDYRGRPLDLTDASGAHTQHTYGTSSRPVRTVLPDGTVWTSTYDERGNRTSVTDPTGATTKYSFDERGGLATITDALAATTVVRCDRSGRPAEVTDPQGNRTLRAYDPLGHLAAITDPTGATTRLEWSAEGRVTYVRHPDGTEETWEYDSEGNCLAHRTVDGSVSKFAYTHFDLLCERTEPDGAQYRFEHDALLRLTKVIDPHGRTWEYRYDAAGNLTAERDFDGRDTTYTRDPAGRLRSRTNALAQTVSYEYDAMDRLTTKRTAGEAVHYEYDALGRLISARSPECQVRWERDSAGRTISESVDGRKLATTHDAAGRVIHRTTPSGVEGRYAYDRAGRRTAVHIGDHALISTLDPSGRETRRVVGDSLTLDQKYDPAGRLLDQVLSQSGQVLQRRSHTYRPDGHLVSTVDPVLGETCYQLDDSARVSGVRAEGWAETYAYDKVGNQTHAVWPSRQGGSVASGERTYTGNRLIHAGSLHHTYDAAGRLVLRRRARTSKKPEVWRYSWDSEDRLTTVITPDGTEWRYRYDPLGRRIAKQRVASDKATMMEETHFTWEGPTLVEQTTVTPRQPQPVVLTWEHNGVTPLAQVERRIDPGSQETVDARFFAIVTDLVGTPTELVEEDGTVAWRSRRTVWGVTSWHNESTAYTPLRFPGQYHDPETGFHYNVHRYYDPTTARYTSPDPLGLGPAPNPVAYVRNPHTSSDPLGLSPYPNSGNADPIDDMIRRIDPENLTESGTVARHRDDVTRRRQSPDGGYSTRPARPFMNSNILLREIMEGSRPILDPRGAAGALRWDTPGAFNGSEGVWELVVDTNNNNILHFNFTR